jgi:signal transduction histidine kinase
VIELGVLVALGTLTAGVAAVLVLRLLPTFRLQLAGLALLSAVLPLGAVLLSGWVMFHMGDDVKILAVAASSAAGAIAVAILLGTSLARRVERLRTAAGELARGDLTARAPVAGPAELAELGAAFNHMAAQLGEVFDARRELVAWASHDLRTPLAAMQAMLEALEDGIGDPERYLPSLREQVRTLGMLVDDLFELARIDAGLLTLELREARIDALVDSCLRTLEPEAEARRVRLEAHVGDGASIRCAPEKVERVLLNLVTNSLRHTPGDGSVAVLVEPEASEVRFTVEDTGDGLAPEAVRRMFDRFWRDDPARTRERGGAGLGLAIARGLVEAHGGRIWAESRPGGGARVSFTLPA